MTGNQQGQSQIGSYGKEIAMGEVDKLQNAVDHGVAKRYQGIDAAHGQSVEKLLYKKVHTLSYMKKAQGRRTNVPLPAQASGQKI